MKVKDLLMILVCVGVVMVCATSLLMRDAIYWTPYSETYKRSKEVSVPPCKTHYHADLCCPLLRYEEPDPHEIHRVVKQSDGTLKQTNSTFQVTRERCPLCAKE